MTPAGPSWGAEHLLEVTDRKLAEEDLKRTKAQLETVLQSGLRASSGGRPCHFTLVNQQRKNSWLRQVTP